MLETILEALRQTVTTYLETLKAFLPRILATLSILVAGWLIAAILRFVARRTLVLLRFNALAQRSGMADILKKADLPDADVLVSSVVFWLVFLGFLLSGIDALGFRGIEGLINEFVLLIPRLFVAIAILIVGAFAANFAWRATLLAAVNARLFSARLMAAGVRFIILVMAVAMALEQVALARAIVQTAFAIVFGAVMLAMAIAFGIGGADVARRLLEQTLSDQGKGTEADSSSHL
jgi:hypothetical protein